jgi:invasion protein IalB
MSTKRISAALLALVLTAMASAAQAAPHRSSGAARSTGAGYQSDEAPWTFACIKDHGASRCSDLN